MRSITDGGRTALKWAAVVAMVFDHVDWLLLDGRAGFHASCGRLVFPVFAYVLAYNLARAPEASGRLLKRLLVFGVIATPAYAYLVGKLVPLNVLFALALFVAVVRSFELRGWRSLRTLALLVVAPIFVDYAWPGLALCLAWWWWYASPSHGQRDRVTSVLHALPLLAAILWLCLMVNGNAWALLVFPLLYAASFLRVDLPRSKWAFYAIYPAHLAVLAVVAVGV